MPAGSQPTQERSRRRRDALLAAAIDLFADGGSRAVTHRAVSARAGVPSATTTYYFESIDDLLREALADHVDRWSADLEALAGLELPGEIDLADAGDFFAAAFTDRDSEVAGRELALFLAAARIPALQQQTVRAVDAIELLATRLLGRTGVDEPTELAAAAVALVAGVALRRQTGARTEQEEARLLGEALRSLVVGHRSRTVAP